MDYKNLYNRLFFSLFFFLIYFISLNNKYLLFIFGTCIYVVIFIEILKFFKNYFIFTCSYLSLSYICFTLYFFIFFDYIIFNILIFTIILYDSFSFVSGKLLGKNYIFKYLSPKKTLEGYLGGIIFTNIMMLSYFYLTNNDINSTMLIKLINLIIITSTIGDLIESYFKRLNNVKDSSQYLPGHGGYFDRFDSFIASIIMLTVFSLF